MLRINMRGITLRARPRRSSVEVLLLYFLSFLVFDGTSLTGADVGVGRRPVNEHDDLITPHKPVLVLLPGVQPDVSADHADTTGREENYLEDLVLRPDPTSNHRADEDLQQETTDVVVTEDEFLRTEVDETGAALLELPEVLVSAGREEDLVLVPTTESTFSFRGASSATGSRGRDKIVVVTKTTTQQVHEDQVERLAGASVADESVEEVQHDFGAGVSSSSWSAINSSSSTTLGLGEDTSFLRSSLFTPASSQLEVVHLASESGVKADMKSQEEGFLEVKVGQLSHTQPHLHTTAAGGRRPRDNENSHHLRVASYNILYDLQTGSLHKGDKTQPAKTCVRQDGGASCIVNQGQVISDNDVTLLGVQEFMDPGGPAHFKNGDRSAASLEKQGHASQEAFLEGLNSNAGRAWELVTGEGSCAIYVDTSAPWYKDHDPTRGGHHPLLLGDYLPKKQKHNQNPAVRGATAAFFPHKALVFASAWFAHGHGVGAAGMKVLTEALGKAITANGIGNSVHRIIVAMDSNVHHRSNEFLRQQFPVSLIDNVSGKKGGKRKQDETKELKLHFDSGNQNNHMGCCIWVQERFYFSGPIYGGDFIADTAQDDRHKTQPITSWSNGAEIMGYWENDPRGKAHGDPGSTKWRLTSDHQPVYKDVIL